MGLGLGLGQGGVVMGNFTPCSPSVTMGFRELAFHVQNRVQNKQEAQGLVQGVLVLEIVAVRRTSRTGQACWNTAEDSGKRQEVGHRENGSLKPLFSPQEAQIFPTGLRSLLRPSLCPTISVPETVMHNSVFFPSCGFGDEKGCAYVRAHTVISGLRACV